jgi:hypothetical protein
MPFSPGQRLIVNWLRAEIEDSLANDTPKAAARRLDWDGEEGCFLESRLYRLNHGRYWLARDWRDPEDSPHDNEILKPGKGSDLE